MRGPPHPHRSFGWWSPTGIPTGIPTATLTVMALVLTASCAGPNVESERAPAEELDGAWRLVSSETIGPDGTRYPGQTHGSLLLISGGYYSMNYVFGSEEPEYFAERFHPTDAEKLARYSSLLVNAGRLELEEGLLTIHPEFALVPEFVGGLGEFEYSLEGDTLQLVWTRIESADGVADPNTDAGVQYVSRWRRIPG